ncbi:uncharacterized protein PGTG_10869 [Puccinia graminis f. sp. tritici CRL 75-36-700-3]|uniref:Uncharacterized protein n=1 Tax=Puccinia graminis f. sp. tritici (strain CRL 75-36-700-3 / race SCCL) TaxID=418459 RepID=E3KK85_PUCGT|nr:uncharacterized protein PGTG_10869 [Puccinia graminis f. sp. tritici CRL 75-36-700-3]EFP84710.1 hypothetical protein PGTG_10869 [Puccinia graminis f. sp. tritici CRL 75-36-700-3]
MFKYEYRLMDQSRKLGTRVRNSNKVKIHKYILLDPSFDLNEDKIMIIGKIDLLHMALYTLGVSQFILSTPIEGFGTIIACFPLEHFHSLLLLDSFVSRF